MPTTSQDPHRADVALAGEPGAPGGSAGRAAAGRVETGRISGGPRVSGRRRAPLPMAAAVAAGWAAIVTYALVAALAAAGAWGSGTPASAVARLAAAGWLLAHGVPIQTPTGRITLVPLALSAFAFWRLTRAGVHASRAIGGHRSRSPHRAVAAAVAVSVGYGVAGWAVASLAGTPDLDLSPWRAGITLGVFAGVAAAVGAIRHSRSRRRLAARVPRVLRDAVRAGIAAAGLAVAAGAATAGVALAIHGGAGAEMLGSYQAGVLGQAGITALCLAYLPNLAIWGAAYLLGPGFSVGTGTVVSPGEVVLGSLPGLPVFAGLPSAALTDVGQALLGIPLLAGVAAGALLARQRTNRSWCGLLGAAALTGPVGGVVAQGLCVASAGALGSGRLAALGATDWRTGAFATLVVGLGALIGAGIAGSSSRRDG